MHPRRLDFMIYPECSVVVEMVLVDGSYVL